MFAIQRKPVLFLVDALCCYNDEWHPKGNYREIIEKPSCEICMIHKISVVAGSF
jgi:hypothetical protein